MKIDKAIEVLDNILSRLLVYEEPDDPEAIKLGIEALKVIKEWRHYPFPDGVIILPGETKE